MIVLKFTYFKMIFLYGNVPNVPNVPIEYDFLLSEFWVQAYNFGKFDFEILVEGEGQKTSRYFKGVFGSMRTMLPI